MSNALSHLQDFLIPKFTWGFTP